MGRGTRQGSEAAAGVAISREEVLRRLRPTASPPSGGASQGAWALWPPDRLVGDRPDVHVHTPEWTAYLNREELGRALLSARADCVLLGEEEFSERMCGQLAQAAFEQIARPELLEACARDEDLTEPRLAVQWAFRELAEGASDEEIGPLTMFARVAMSHVHRAFWNERGTSKGHPMRVRGFVEDPRGEVTDLEPRAAEWLRRVELRTRYGELYR